MRSSARTRHDTATALRRRKLPTALALLALPVQAADLTRAEEIVGGRCFLCHGMEGEAASALYPRLAGQHADYTVKQMVAFRDGTRTNNAVMQGVAAKMNDREIKAVSDYIAGLR